MSVAAGEPEISVCVPTRARPLRLRWLLNALEEQTLSDGRFEVLVAHLPESETERVLERHPLAESGALRAVRVEGTGSAGALRNAAWRRARAPLIAFTDDDCRPPAQWLARMLQACDRLPGAVVQGRVSPDPEEAGLLVAAGFHRTIETDPPEVESRTANIVYPRALLERLGGFTEDLRAAEDVELGARARGAGALVLGAPAAETYHAVEPGGVRARIRSGLRYTALPHVVKRHPSVRREFPLRAFWKPSHPWLLAAGAAAVLARRRPVLWLVPVAWAIVRMPSYGSGGRGRVRALVELPGHAAVDAAEICACAAGSARARTVFL